MIVDTQQVLRAIDGAELISGNEVNPDGSPVKVILGKVVVAALLADIQNDPDNGSAKQARYRLATRFHKALGKGTGKLNLNSNEVVLVKRMIAKSFSPIISGQIWDILDLDPDAETSNEDEEE